MKLIDGPLEGTECEPGPCARVVFPFTRMNDAGTDQVLGQWTYTSDGRFVEETISTTTWNDDSMRETIRWLWSDDRDHDLDEYHDD